MKQRRRIYYSAAQRSEIWDRWQAGEPMSAVEQRDNPDLRAARPADLPHPGGGDLTHTGVG
jgi:hypothetical protein